MDGVARPACADAVSNVQASLDEYRRVREALERAVLPLATSVDGRRFSFQTTLYGLELEAGGYVTLESDGSTRLGQVLSLELGSQDTTAPGLPQVRIRAGLTDWDIAKARKCGEGNCPENAVHRRHDSPPKPAPQRRGDQTGTRSV